MKLIQTKNGTWSERKEPYAVIVCATADDFEFLQRAIEHYRRYQWTSCSERLPENDNYILLSFENFSVPLVGRYEGDKKGGDFYIGDAEESCQDLIAVNAWMPLPESYREES